MAQDKGGKLTITPLVDVLLIGEIELVHGYRERKFRQKWYLFGDTDTEKKDVLWAQE